MPAAAWREWAASEGLLRPLRRRLTDLGASEEGRSLVGDALAEVYLNRVDSTGAILDVGIPAGVFAVYRRYRGYFTG